MSNHLQVLLGLNCNFKCRHCLNGSGPGIKSVFLAEQDVTLIINELLDNQSIDKVGFSGGEPLIYIEIIQNIILQIKKNIQREIRFTITTNGSLLEKNIDFFQANSIDSIILSFDKWHLEFTSVVDFTNSVKLAKKICKNVEISFVYEDESEINLIKDTAFDLDVKILFSKVVKSGRFEKLISRNENSIESLKCPNIANERKNVDQYLFYPSKGYSICCGPLAFSTNIQSVKVFSENIKGIVESDFYEALTMLSKKRIKKVFSTDCDNCQYIFTNKTIISNLKMLASENLWDNFIDLKKSTLSLTELNDLDTVFHPKYFYVADINEIKKSDNCNISKPNLEVKIINNPSNEDIKKISDFIKLNFYQDNLQHYDKLSDMDIFYNQQKVYFNNETKNILHTVGEKIISVITICKIEKHKYLNESVWHVGYWGMLKDISDKNIRDCIKNSWNQLQLDLNKNSKLVVGVDYFNKSSYTLAEKFGYKKLGIRLDPR